MLQQIIFFLIFAVVIVYLFNQVRKPDRFAGRFYTWGMNSSHSALTDWGLSFVHIEPNFTILDVGCGGGRTIQKLAVEAPRGKVFGIDYAKGSIAASRATNADLIKVGRVDVQLGSVSSLRFSDDTFDLVTAVETQYYWPDLQNDMREVFRVLKPGGALTIIAESYKGGLFYWLQMPIMWGLRSNQLSLEDQHNLFFAAGFVDIQIHEESKKGWICAVGRKAEV